MFRKIIVISVIVISLITIGFIWHHSQLTKVSTTVASTDPSLIQISVTKSRLMTLPDEINAVGLLKSQNDINITSQISGKITAITFTPGSFVTKGTSLLQLDARMIQAKIMSDQAALDSTKAEYFRFLKLATLGVETQEKLDSTQEAYKQAQANLFSDQTSLDQTNITAPFNGFVGSKLVSVGDAIQANQTLTSLTDRANLFVDYQVPEEYLTKLKLGQNVSVEIKGSQTFFVNGKVIYISPTINTDTHTLEIQAEIPNSQNQLAPGLFVTVHQQIGMNKNVVVIPQQSLLSSITGPQVYIVENNKAQLINLKIGAVIKDEVLVKSGLKEGEVIVISGMEELKDGSSIHEVNTP